MEPQRSPLKESNAGDSLEEERMLAGGREQQDSCLALKAGGRSYPKTGVRTGVRLG